MLRSVIVAEFHRFFDGSRLNQDALRDGLTHDVCPWESPCLCVNLFFDFGNGFGGKVDGEEDDLGVDAVFGLGEEIGRDERWVGGFIGDNLDTCVNPDPWELMDDWRYIPKPRRAQLAYRWKPRHLYRFARTSSQR